MRKLALTCLVTGVLAVATGGGALAVGTLEISPTPVVLGSTFTLHGCGYPEGSAVFFEVSGPKKSSIHYFTTAEPSDTDGCVTDEWTAWWDVAGDYQITSWYRDGKGTSRKGAVLKFAVTEP